MPMSRFARSDWLGSSTSPPLIRRSNLSLGPMAAKARPDGPELAAASAREPAPSMKSRRDAADMSIPLFRRLDLVSAAQQASTFACEPEPRHRTAEGKLTPDGVRARNPGHP